MISARCASCHTDHDYAREEIVYLLEEMSCGDWEDGPRCLTEILTQAKADGSR